MRKTKSTALAMLLTLVISGNAFSKSGTISTTSVGTISTTAAGTISTTRTGTISTTSRGTISTTAAATISTTAYPTIERTKVLYDLGLFDVLFSLYIW
ncbi:MAG TPA: hypothetical protein VJ372_25500 [Pyrinomonadaceae bacterium]|nr:hypothetical protein [Pyrinomonadaceae bacterium]